MIIELFESLFFLHTFYGMFRFFDSLVFCFMSHIQKLSKLMMPSIRTTTTTTDKKPLVLARIVTMQTL